MGQDKLDELPTLIPHAPAFYVRRFNASTSGPRLSVRSEYRFRAADGALPRSANAAASDGAEC